MKLGRNTAGYASAFAQLFGAPGLGNALQSVQNIKDKERDHRFEKKKLNSRQDRRKKRRQQLTIQSQSHYD